MKELIKVSDISYKAKDKTIVDGVSFSVHEHDTFALLGENGSGKSTLIDLMLHDLNPKYQYTAAWYIHFAIWTSIIILFIKFKNILL